MRLIAIDPGPEQSAYVIYDNVTGEIVDWAKLPNIQVARSLRAAKIIHRCDHLAIEMIASYGMPVGAEVFETCVWIGRFTERWGRWGTRSPRPVVRVTRLQVKSHLCHSAKATDANVRQALIDRYGPGKEKAIGKKATPGPLYGLSGDGWAALGVAVTVAETNLAKTTKV